VNAPDPTLWVDEWPLPGLQEIDRVAIKSQLFKAHAANAERRNSGISFYGQPEALAQAFRGIAEILWSRGLITVEVLENQLPLFILEAALAGEWSWIYKRRELSDREEIFPGYLGHAQLWFSFSEDSNYGRVFDGEIAHWKSRLLDEQIAEAQRAMHDSSPVIPAVPSPRELAETYFAKFPDERIIIRDLCWAAGQHYREWKRWVAGKAKAGAG
jgi:hypothetical protein